MSSDSTADAWVSERPRLLGLAYTVLGSWQDAEDVVSEAWLRLEKVDRTAQAPRDVASWLTTVVSRLALDAATTAAKRRETYVGQWLPDVVAGDAAPESAEDRVLLGEHVDLAFVRLLQTLGPVDRVIVVLGEVAGLPHKEIGEVTGTTPAATRQRLRRARTAIGAPGKDSPDTTGGVVAHSADRDLLDELSRALNTGDLQVLVTQLSEGCVLWTDSGGLSRAALNPVRGAAKVIRFLQGLITKYGMPRIEVVDAVGGPVLRAVSTDMTRTVALEVADGHVTGIQIQQNPHKITTTGDTSSR